MTEKLPYSPLITKLLVFFQEAQEKIVRLEKEQEDARSDIKVIFYFPTPNPLPNFYCRSTPW